MENKKLITISDLKWNPQKFVSFLNWEGKVLNIARMDQLQDKSRSEDLIDTNYYISGKVTAHFNFPIHPSDTNYGRWKRFEQNFIYLEPQTNYGDEILGSYDITFIEDGTAGIAVIGLQFYGKSRLDLYKEIETKKIVSFKVDLTGQITNEQIVSSLPEKIKTPPNVNSGYIPHEYHIQVGDTLEIYAGRILHRKWFRPNPEWANESDLTNTPSFFFEFSKNYLSLVNSTVAYTLIPNESYLPKENISKTNRILDDVYEKNVEIKKTFPIPKRTTITLIDRDMEGMLVRIRRVKLSIEKYSTTNSLKQLKLIPGKLYTVVDRFGSEIDFRICHGTEMARFFTPIPVDREFDLIGIVAGTDAYGSYEIWPRTMYDLGLPHPMGDLIEYTGGLSNEI